MKRFLPFAFGMLTAATAHAGGCTGSSGIVSTTGLGDEGFACSQQPLRPNSPALRVFIVTGDDNLSPVFTITVDVSPLVNNNTFGGPRFGLCGVPLPTTTDPSYAWGYPTPDWPDVFFDSPKEDANGKTVTIRGRVRDPLNWKPDSNYTLNIICTPRIF